MSHSNLIQALIDTVERILPEFLADPEDFRIAEGNMAFYILDESGNLYGRMFGTDRAKQRISGKVAWHKVTQVWLTGKATGTYERMVYNNEVPWWEYVVPKNEFIGWEGGVPARLDDGTILSLALSGLRGDKDVEVLGKAVALVGGIRLLD